VLRALRGFGIAWPGVLSEDNGLAGDSEKTRVSAYSALSADLVLGAQAIPSDDNGLPADSEKTRARACVRLVPRRHCEDRRPSACSALSADLALDAQADPARRLTMCCRG
jgi:hypothetical protein